MVEAASTTTQEVHDTSRTPRTLFDRIAVEPSWLQHFRESRRHLLWNLVERHAVARSADSERKPLSMSRMCATLIVHLVRTRWSARPARSIRRLNVSRTRLAHVSPGFFVEFLGSNTCESQVAVEHHGKGTQSHAVHTVRESLSRFANGRKNVALNFVGLDSFVSQVITDRWSHTAKASSRTWRRHRKQVHHVVTKMCKHGASSFLGLDTFATQVTTHRWNVTAKSRSRTQYQHRKTANLD